MSGVQVNPDFGHLILKSILYFLIVLKKKLTELSFLNFASYFCLFINNLSNPTFYFYDYSGDLNSEHLNSGTIWITNFYLFAIQMFANSSLFKPSVTQPISQTTYDLNIKLLVRYSHHVLKNKLLVRYSSLDLNNEPFKQRTILHHLNTQLVCFSDPHWPHAIKS